MKKIFAFGLILFIGFVPIYAGADVIDFESGYADGDSVGTVITATNQVSFWATIKPSTGSGVFKAEIAKVGDPRTAFRRDSPVSGDTPSGSGAGLYFLTDQNPQAAVESYFLQFSSPVADIALDLYDFDKGTGNAVLTAYSNFNWTGNVGSTTPLSKLSDGSVVNLSIPNPSSPISSVSLTWVGDPGYSIDNGTGIDNISFATVPIPGAIWLLGSGLLGLVGIRSKFRKA